MQFKQFFLALCALTLIFSACRKDDEVVITPPDEEEPPVEDNTFIIKAIVDGDTLDFPFEECGFDSGLQSSWSGWGTTTQGGVTYNKKRLRTVIKPSEATKLYIGLEWKQPQTEGELDFTRMSEILESDINNRDSEYLNLSLALELDDVYYRNQSSDYNFNNPVDYSYEITEHEFGYNAECLIASAIRLKGNFKGTFSDYEFGEPVDSIYVEVPDFEVLILIY